MLELIRRKYEIIDHFNALGILSHYHPAILTEIVRNLEGFTLRKSDIVTPGGRKSPIPAYFETTFREDGWCEKRYGIQQVCEEIDTQTKAVKTLKEIEIKTHQIDLIKNRIGIEIEWNNKTEFFDRDLMNTLELYQHQLLDMLIIITRTTELDEQVFKPLGLQTKYGASTTHLNKLMNKLNYPTMRGCPMLVFAIKPDAYDPSQ